MSNMSEKKTSSQLILFAEDSPAKTLAPLGKLLESTAVAPGFGGISTESFASFGPDWLSLKMSERYLAEVSAKSWEALPPSGMMRNGQLFRRAYWEPLTREREYSLWPTPTARDGMVVRNFSLACRTKVGTHRRQLARLPEVIAAEFSWSHHPELAEWMMGFPLQYTDLKRLVTP